jgi:hypothetical protein
LRTLFFVTCIVAAELTAFALLQNSVDTPHRKAFNITVSILLFGIIVPLSFRETLKGNKPSNMRKVIVDSIEYESLSYGARQIGIPISTMKNRLKSPKFDNYKYKD